jgi:hypothetical protein
LNFLEALRMLFWPTKLYQALQMRTSHFIVANLCFAICRLHELGRILLQRLFPYPVESRTPGLRKRGTEGRLQVDVTSVPLLLLYSIKWIGSVTRAYCVFGWCTRDLPDTKCIVALLNIVPVETLWWGECPRLLCNSQVFPPPKFKHKFNV